MSRCQVSGEPARVEHEDVWIENGIVLLRWPVGVVITGVTARRAFDEVNRVSADRPRPMLVDMANTKSVAREARTVFGEPSAASRIALLGRSPVDRVIANFTLGVSRVPCPTKFFTNRDQAMAFLREGLDERSD